MDGATVSTVLLDQANRMEEALLKGWRVGDPRGFPVIEVDFLDRPTFADFDSITSLQAPHRVADAQLRTGPRELPDPDHLAHRVRGAGLVARSLKGAPAWSARRSRT